MEKQRNRMGFLPNNLDDCIERAIRSCTTTDMLNGMRDGIKKNNRLDTSQKRYYGGLISEQRQVLQRRMYGDTCSHLQTY